MPDVLGVQQGREPLRAAVEDRAGRAHVSGDDQGGFLVEDVADGGGEAREPGIEFGMDLVAEIGILPHQIATGEREKSELTMRASSPAAATASRTG